LKSSRFDVARAGANFIFRGSGFGHGLGLCQEGAHVMAARGMGYQKILEKYFPGTVVKNPAWKPDLLPLSLGEGRSEGLASTPDYFSVASAGESPKPATALSQKNRGRFLTISSEHFRVTYPADVDRRDADQVLHTLESARSDFIRRASSASISASIPTLEIRLNQSTGDFTSRTGQPWWAAAATKGNRIELQPLTLLKKRGVLFTTLRHELAHVVIDQVSNNRSPRWLEEGFSIYLAGEGRLFAHYTRSTLASDELERRLDHPRTQSEMRELYAQAYLTVSEIVRQQGEASVWQKLTGR
jgi:hypothetical protein